MKYWLTWLWVASSLAVILNFYKASNPFDTIDYALHFGTAVNKSGINASNASSAVQYCGITIQDSIQIFDLQEFCGIYQANQSFYLYYLSIGTLENGGLSNSIESTAEWFVETANCSRSNCSNCACSGEDFNFQVSLLNETQSAIESVNFTASWFLITLNQSYCTTCPTWSHLTFRNPMNQSQLSNLVFVNWRLFQYKRCNTMPYVTLISESIDVQFNECDNPATAALTPTSTPTPALSRSSTPSSSSEANATELVTIVRTSLLTNSSLLATPQKTRDKTPANFSAFLTTESTQNQLTTRPIITTTTPVVMQSIALFSTLQSSTTPSVSISLSLALTLSKLTAFWNASRSTTTRRVVFFPSGNQALPNSPRFEATITPSTQSKSARNSVQIKMHKEEAEESLGRTQSRSRYDSIATKSQSSHSKTNSRKKNSTSSVGMSIASQSITITQLVESKTSVRKAQRTKEDKTANRQQQSTVLKLPAFQVPEIVKVMAPEKQLEKQLVDELYFFSLPAGIKDSHSKVWFKDFELKKTPQKEKVSLDYGFQLKWNNSIELCSQHPLFQLNFTTFCRVRVSTNNDQLTDLDQQENCISSLKAVRCFFVEDTEYDSSSSKFESFHLDTFQNGLHWKQLNVLHQWKLSQCFSNVELFCQCLQVNVKVGVFGVVVSWTLDRNCSPAICINFTRPFLHLDPHMELLLLDEQQSCEKASQMSILAIVSLALIVSFLGLQCLISFLYWLWKSYERQKVLEALNQKATPK